MKLLEEMRNLDVGDPGRWSKRVSVALACCLFVLLAVLGLRLRVFGNLAPRLEHARLNAAALDRQLVAARNEARALQEIGEEEDRAQASLRTSGVWIPSQAQELDLAVALAAGRDHSPLQAVQPWEPQGDFPPRLQRAGAELYLSGSYGHLAAFLESALGDSALRELLELRIESQGPQGGGRLRASARLVAYFGGSGTAGLLRTRPENPPASGAAEYPHKLASLPSPFGGSAAFADGTDPLPEHSALASGWRGFIQVGARRYELVEDAGGKLSLRATP